MKKNLLLALLFVFSVNTFAQRVANTLTPLVQKNLATTFNFNKLKVILILLQIVILLRWDEKTMKILK